MLVALSTPLKVGDAEVKSLDLKLESLTGANAMKLAMIAGQKRGVPFSLELRLDEFFQIEVAAEAAGIDAEVVRNLPIKDFLAVTAAVRDFLLGAD
jgi:hypothetical protein